jgi:hypothetical protein
MRSNKLKDIEWEYHFAGQMFCEMLCQVAIKEIIARDMAGHQEVPFFLYEFLIERLLVSIAGTLRLGYITQNCQTSI